MRTKLMISVIALLAVATLTAVANAASGAQKPLTGTWTGKTSQDIVITDPSTGEDYESEWSKRMTVTALNGRLVSIAATVRVVCPGPGVLDLLIRKTWRVTKRGVSTGPELGKHGGFGVHVEDTSGRHTVNVGGTLNAASATAHFDTSTGDCEGKGSWKAKRRI